jgi:hypothetical protein
MFQLRTGDRSAVDAAGRQRKLNAMNLGGAARRLSTWVWRGGLMLLFSFAALYVLLDRAVNHLRPVDAVRLAESFEPVKQRGRDAQVHLHLANKLLCHRDHAYGFYRDDAKGVANELRALLTELTLYYTFNTGRDGSRESSDVPGRNGCAVDGTGECAMAERSRGRGARYYAAELADLLIQLMHRSGSGQLARFPGLAALSRLGDDSQWKMPQLRTALAEFDAAPLMLRLRAIGLTSGTPAVPSAANNLAGRISSQGRRPTAAVA